MESSGIIIMLSYPDTVVRPAYSEFSSKVWPLIGVGSKHAVQAGHAALLLIDKESKQVNYYDFGRYITSYGFGRVRSKETDPELLVPLKAEFRGGQLNNVNELLLWLDLHPEKTHGEGRLVASVNTYVNYEKAQSFINGLIDEKEIPYGAFNKRGSNCARFVTDMVLNSCTDKKIRLKLKTSNLFTPSPIGNVIKGVTGDEIYVVQNQKISHYPNRSVLKEYGACFLNKFDHELNLSGTELPNSNVFELENGTWLGGIGSGAWFKVEEKIDKNHYRITRYNAVGEKDFESVFKLRDEMGFDFEKGYEIIHPTNCLEVFLQQDNKIISFKKV